MAIGYSHSVLKSPAHEDISASKAVFGLNSIDGSTDATRAHGKHKAYRKLVINIKVFVRPLLGEGYA